MEHQVLPEISISDLFEQFIDASTMRNVLSIHHRILRYADLEPCEFDVFFPKLKRAVIGSRQRKNWKAKALFSKIDKKAAHKCYSNTKVAANPNIGANESLHEAEDGHSLIRATNSNNALQFHNCLIIGGGPAGLRTAIELQLLGANRVVIAEKRNRFSRNNVLHLWPFVIDDLKSLGAKKFYGKFCAGSIDHISIRQLQLMLLKSIKSSSDPDTKENICDSGRTSCPFDNLDKSEIDCDQTRSESTSEKNTEISNENGAQVSKNSIIGQTNEESQSRGAAMEPERLVKLRGAKIHFESDYKPAEKELHSKEWDIIIGADGRRNTLGDFFPRKEFRGRLAIAITANFINRQTQAETSVSEISGLSFIYNQDMFNTLAHDTNIQLENICYYKDDTHYFVMTAKKKSLLERGVLISDYAATQDLLSEKNVNRQALLKYAKDAAFWTTGLDPLDFALNHYGQEDCAMFDFTSMHAASNACKAIRTSEDGLALVGLVGDSLLEPFWPTGSGCARGFLSSLDAAWMCRQWSVNKCAVLSHRPSPSPRFNGRTRQGGHSTDSRNRPTTHDRMACSVIAERESIYRILGQTTSENLQQNYSRWSLNPHTRYPNLNRHLVLPSQVEHLLGGKDSTKNDENLLRAERQRRPKSPKMPDSRKISKKLKSADASPFTRHRLVGIQARDSLRLAGRSRSQHDVSASEDTFLEYERSYRELVDLEQQGIGGNCDYNRPPNCELFDDLFGASLSGTMPSSHNLLSLEARRARDIDECLKQRREKSKINVVREQLSGYWQNETSSKGARTMSGGNAVLFNELKRLREQHNKVLRGDSKPRDVTGPLSLLNSMRRCASFAERVKSFENRLVSSTSTDRSDSEATTPKTPIDKVTNLPQFNTLQELISGGRTNSNHSDVKSRIPVSKLTKDDWNVRCWEKRVASGSRQLSAAKSHQLNGSSKSLNQLKSEDNASKLVEQPRKSVRQVELFRGRINEMAEKLRLVESTTNHLQSRRNYERTKHSASEQNVKASNFRANIQPRSRCWVDHVKRELVRGVESKKLTKQPMNPVLPGKPIKKLFEDEDGKEDDIDIDQHYDHLCVNRPTNKYLSKVAYTSHLVRTRHNSPNAVVIERPTAESKKAYLTMLTSRGSSASSTLSDYSSKTSSDKGSVSSSSVIDVECVRCQKFISAAERIIFGTAALHRTCLTCAHCGITLRSGELRYYIDNATTTTTDGAGSLIDQQERFACVICRPNLRARLDCSQAPSVESSNDDCDEHTGPPTCRSTIQTREQFLNSSINYDEIYKNILDKENIPRVEKELRSTKTSTMPSVSGCPMQQGNGADNARYRIVSSETVDGDEQVTIVLPVNSSSAVGTPCDEKHLSRNSHRAQEMIDEEELQRILHLDKHNQSAANDSDDQSSVSGDRSIDITSSDNSSSGRPKTDRSISKATRTRTSHRVSMDSREETDDREHTDDESSSLNSPPDTDEYEDDDDEKEDNDDEDGDQNSTCNDLITSEEFDASSEKDYDNNVENEVEDMSVAKRDAAICH